MPNGMGTTNTTGNITQSQRKCLHGAANYISPPYGMCTTAYASRKKVLFIQKSPISWHPQRHIMNRYLNRLQKIIKKGKRKMKIVLHEQTKQDLVSYMASSHGPLILYGKHGMGQEETAEKIARELLGIAESFRLLSTHPDYYEIRPENGMIRTGQMIQLQEWCCYKAAEADKKVILIYGAEQMNPNAQNSILKLLEDGTDSHIIVMISQGPLLETIHSRCHIIHFQKIPQKQMEDMLAKTCQGLGMQEQKTLGILADGRYGLLQELLKKRDSLKWAQTYLDTLTGFKERKELLDTLHTIREKDKRYIYDTLKEEGSLTLFFELNLSMFGNALRIQAGILSSDAYAGHLARQYGTEEIMNI